MNTIEDCVRSVEDAIALSEKAVAELQQDLREREEKLRQAFAEAMQYIESSTIDLDELDSFVSEWTKRPYAIIPRKEREWLLIVPKIFKLHFGWFEREEGAYNVFVVNPYFDLIQPIPPQLKEELDLSRPFDGILVDQGRLIIKRPDKDPIKKVQKHYQRYLAQKPIDERTLRVKKGQEFNLIAALIRDGILPFVPRPVSSEDIQDRHCKFTLRDYQQRDFDRFLELGACGIFYPMGMGKTVMGLEAMCQLKGRKLVLVPSVMLREQWLENIRENTDLRPDEYLVQVYHKNYVPKLMREEWTLVIYDECHRLPANTFLQLSTLRTKYRLNLTATPFREDGRIDLVWALSGMPLGVNWTYFLERGLIIQPEIVVFIESDIRAKTERCDDLLTREGKTIIFCDSLDLGHRLSKRYQIPFIHGGTPAKDRMVTVRKSEQVIVSRVGDMGISVSDLERVIEFDFLYGSRSQEMQRMGRLFHGAYRGEHNVLMTVKQYIRHRKRLYGVYEKGFKVKIVRGPGVPADLSVHDRGHARSARVQDLRPFARRPSRERAPSRKTQIPAEDTNQFPPFDERRKLDKELILEILGSDYVVNQGGVEIKTVRAILDHSYIKYRAWYTVRDLVTKLYKDFDIAGRTIGRTRIYFLSKQKSDS